ncbi:MAG: DUF3106 domain-containing protein, partial [Planctomycetota bacterium]
MTGCLLLPIAGRAAIGGEKKPGDEKAKLLERLRRLPADEKRVLLERLRRWNKMTEEEKARIRQNLEVYRTLPEMDRKTIQGNLEKWKKRDPKQKKEIKKNHAEWKDLSAKLKDALVRRFRLLSNLPPKERERIMNLPEAKRLAVLERLFVSSEVERLKKRLTKKERESLKGLDIRAQKDRALGILKKRREAHLDRMSKALRARVKTLPPRERAQAERRFLKQVHLRDQ